MTTRSLFQQAFAETGHDNDANTGWTFATQMSSSDPVAWITGVLWAPSVAAAGAYDWRVYTGHIGEPRTLTASGALGAYAAGAGWQTFTIPPVDVSGQNFMIAIRSTAADNTYAYATGKWPASNGPLSGPGASGGAFSSSGGAPDNGSVLVFMLDALVSDTVPGALQGEIAMTEAISATAAGRAIARGSVTAAQAVGLTLAGRTVPLAAVAAAESVSLAAAGQLVHRAAAQLGVSIALTMTPTGSVIIPGTLTAGTRAPAVLNAAGLPAVGLTPA